MSPLAMTSTVALLAAAVAASASPSVEQAIGQLAARKQQDAPKQSTEDATSVLASTSTAKVLPGGLSPDSQRHRASRKRRRRSLFRRVRRQGENQGYYSDINAAQYGPNNRNDPRERWDTSAHLVDQEGNLPAEDPYGPYPAVVRSEDSPGEDAAQPLTYDAGAEQEQPVEAANAEESATYDYGSAPRKKKRDAVPGNADAEGVEGWSQQRYNPPTWNEGRRTWDQYKNRRDYGANRNSEAQQRSYSRRGGDASRFFSPEEEQPASDNSFAGYAQEVAGQDGIVEHAGDNV